MRLIIHRTGKPYPVKHYVNMLIVILFTALVLDFMISYASISIVKQQSGRSLRDTADLYINRINHDFAYINHYMGWSLANDQIIETMDENASGSAEFLKSNTQLHQRFTELQKNYGQAYQFFIYLKNKDFFLNCAPLSIGYPDYLELKRQIISYAEDKNVYDKFYSRWTPVLVRNKYYIVNIVPYHDRYLICLISADELIRPLQSIDMGKNGTVSLVDEQGINISTPIRVDETQALDTAKPSPFGLAHSRAAVTSRFSDASFSVQMIARYGTFEKIMIAQLVIILLALMIAIVLCIVMLYFNKRVLRPIQSFSDTLTRWNEESAALDFKNSKIIELEQASQQFKHLIGQIRRFKIDMYEQELEKQRIQLDYMKLQINPHFFLNCLTSMYSMAQMQMYGEIERMAMSTTQYFRYIFQNGHNFVRLQDEIEHVRIYLDIQRHRYRNAFAYHISQDAGTGDIRIPPLVLQTFIENAVKYAVSRVTEANITLSVSRKMPDDLAKITISDSGPGFPPDILEQLMHGGPLNAENGNRIGIMNTIQRLSLLYKGQADVSFSNREGGGAEVTMTIPVSPPEAID